MAGIGQGEKWGGGGGVVVHIKASEEPQGVLYGLQCGQKESGGGEKRT